MATRTFMMIAMMTIPSGGADFYRTWAAGKTFAVGDKLVFNFHNGAHDVAEVTSASCSGASQISRSRTGPTTITLTSAGRHYFISTVPGHCNAGQQLAITVSSTATVPSPSTAASRTTPSAQSPSGVATAPTPANSATSLGVASLFVTFLSTLIALVY